MAIVTLITDFGTQDGYVGAMKGVILSIAPDATLVDLTHDIPPQDVAAAAFALAQSAPQFPPGTVHLVVVDPGVGSARREVAIDDGWQRFVGPDNGVFALAVTTPKAVHEITTLEWRRAEVSATFHGRDVFAPAAARLATGATISEAGAEVKLEGTLGRRPPTLSKDGRVATGQVVHVDRFGNLIADVHVAEEGAQGVVKIGRLSLPLQRTYADVAVGKPLAYVGSSGLVEIAVRDGSAARALKLKRGAKVVLELVAPARRARKRT